MAAPQFAEASDDVAFLVNSSLALHHQNRLSLIAVGNSSCRFLYQSSPQLAYTTTPGSSTASLASHATSTNDRLPGGIQQSPLEEITEELRRFSEGEAEALADQSEEEQKHRSSASLLSGALSLALTYVTKSLKAPPPHPRPRILCLQGSPDSSQQYIAIMNSIFSAQRSGVPIDTCMVGATDSAFLQQAAHLTGGVYLKPRRLEGLLQYINMVFSADLHSRRFLQLPRPAGVDFRASCFCHKKTIDVGWVCSVCLSIFCKQSRACTTCGANFAKQGTAGSQPRK